VEKTYMYVWYYLCQYSNSYDASAEAGIMGVFKTREDAIKAMTDYLKEEYDIDFNDKKSCEEEDVTISYGENNIFVYWYVDRDYTEYRIEEVELK
jgi:hypothetical protein